MNLYSVYSFQMKIQLFDFTLFINYLNKFEPA